MKIGAPFKSCKWTTYTKKRKSITSSVGSHLKNTGCIKNVYKIVISATDYLH